MKNRIFTLIDRLQLSPTKFADNIGINRSTISGIKSGRTQPTLQLFEKIHNTYPEVNLYWLLSGEGEVFASQPNILEHQSEDYTSADEDAENNRMLDIQFPDDDIAPACNNNQPNDTAGSQSTVINQIIEHVEKPNTGNRVSDNISSACRQSQTQSSLPHLPTRKIIRIITFFSDGTYEQFTPE